MNDADDRYQEREIEHRNRLGKANEEINRLRTQLVDFGKRTLPKLQRLREELLDLHKGEASDQSMHNLDGIISELEGM